jgi:hypothetical protein
MGILQALEGHLHALLANPLHGAATEALLKGVVKGAAGVVALGFKNAQGQGLGEMERDVVEEPIQALVAAARFPVVKGRAMAQVGK